MLFQPKPGSNRIPPPIEIDNKPLAYVESFKYLGSVLSSDTSIDAEIFCRISKATSSYWKVGNEALETLRNNKLSVYRAVVLSRDLDFAKS